MAEDRGEEVKDGKAAAEQRPDDEEGRRCAAQRRQTGADEGADQRYVDRYAAIVGDGWKTMASILSLKSIYLDTMYPICLVSILATIVSDQ